MVTCIRAIAIMGFCVGIFAAPGIGNAASSLSITSVNVEPVDKAKDCRFRWKAVVRNIGSSAASNMVLHGFQGNLKRRDWDYVGGYKLPTIDPGKETSYQSYFLRKPYTNGFRAAVKLENVVPVNKYLVQKVIRLPSMPSPKISFANFRQGLTDYKLDLVNASEQGAADIKVSIWTAKSKAGPWTRGITNAGVPCIPGKGVYKWTRRKPGNHNHVKIEVSQGGAKINSGVFGSAKSYQPSSGPAPNQPQPAKSPVRRFQPR